MRAFFTVIFVALGIIFLSVAIFAGFKALARQTWMKIRGVFGGKKPNVSAANNKTDDSDNQIKVINVTTGQCQCCGRTYIGTTEDKEQPLKVVEFMGESRMLCPDCLARLQAEFNRTAVSNEKKLSPSAKNLSDLLASIRAQK